MGLQFTFEESWNLSTLERFIALSILPASDLVGLPHCKINPQTASISVAVALAILVWLGCRALLLGP
jgi:hypothetical protein